MGLFQELMKRVSRPKDVKLPNETGVLDQRLPQTPKNVIDATRGAIKGITKPRK